MPKILSSVLVLNDAGGVGKTLTSRLLVAARPGCRPVGFDRAQSVPTSKLCRLLAMDGIETLDLVSDLDLLQARDTKAGFELFDPIGEAVLKGSAVIDAGAKVARNLALWARAAGGAEFLRAARAPVHVVVPVTATAVALRAGREAIEQIAVRGVLDAYHPVVVFNGTHGEFDEIVGNADLEWIQGRVIAGRAKAVVMPRCRGGVMPFIEAERIGFAEALTISPSEFSKRFGVPELRALWGLRCFVEFVAGVLDGFAKAGLGRPPVAEEARLAKLEAAWQVGAETLRSEIVGRVQAVAVGVGEAEVGILRKIDREDAALLAEAFPETLQRIGQEIQAAMLRGQKPDFEATRRAVESVFRAAEERQRKAGIHPRLGRYRRDVVLEAKRHGIDPASHRVAAVSYVQDLSDLGRAGLWRGYTFLARYYAESLLLKLRVIRARTWPPALY